MNVITNDLGSHGRLAGFNGGFQDIAKACGAAPGNGTFLPVKAARFDILLDHPDAGLFAIGYPPVEYCGVLLVFRHGKRERLGYQ